MTSEELRVALEELGDDSVEIASNLLTNGCMGLRRSMCFCPVANYLKKRFDLRAGVRVGFGKASVEDIATNLPAGVRLFIGDFDRGYFDELTKEGV